MSAKRQKDDPVLEFAGAAEWRKWLAGHRGRADGVWLRLAKAGGRWERAYDGARSASVPEDLAAALKRNARARAFFEKLDRANRYAILWRVQTAKDAETRAERIGKFVAMCAKGETIHPKRAARQTR